MNNPIRYFLLVFSLLCMQKALHAQQDTLNRWTFGGYGELYYSYDFSKPDNHERPYFLYNHKRHNEVNANLLLARTDYRERHTRASLGIMAGHYAQYNLATEPEWARFVYEANIGVRLSERHQLWLDAGIMPSHIGFESAISDDCWTLTRSLLAENSPYYEAGIKLSFVPGNDKLRLSLLYLNGWQRISRPSFIQRPSFGMQLTYRPATRLTFNYSNFLGSNRPDSADAFRHFHNLYAIYEPSERFGLIAGFDIGSDKDATDAYRVWYSPVAIVRYHVAEKTSVALRGEYYDDRDQLIITTGTRAGFRTYGISANLDYRVTEQVRFRIECKRYQSKDPIFPDGLYENYVITTNLTIRL